MEKRQRQREEIKKAILRDGETSQRNDFDGYPQRRHLETVDGRVSEIEKSVKEIKGGRKRRRRCR